MEERISRRLVFDGFLKNEEEIFLKISDSNQYFEKHIYNDNGENINVKNDEIDDNRPMYLTILTKNSIDYDYYNLNTEERYNSEYYDKEYKPYLMYYVVDNIDEIKKIKEINSRSNGDWITVKYVKNDNRHNEEECIKGNLFLNYFLKNNNKCLQILSFDIDLDVLKRIKVIYDIDFEKYNIGEKVINNININTIPEKIKVYNVGHGNINLISGQKSCILFDIGCHRGYNNKWQSEQNYNGICSSLKNIKPDCVVISHWDIDHYKGYGVLDKKVFSVPWIVPSLLGNSGENIYRLLIYMNIKKSLYFFDVNQSVNYTLYTNKMIKIILKNGNGQTENGITEKNRKGLYIEITKENKKYFLMGDTPYKCANINNTTQVDLLVVPHHGSNTINSNFPNPSTKKSIAVVCEKDKNVNKCNTHMKELVKQGFDVYFVSGNKYKTRKNTKCFKWFEYDISTDTYQWKK